MNFSSSKFAFVKRNSSLFCLWWKWSDVWRGFVFKWKLCSNRWRWSINPFVFGKKWSNQLNFNRFRFIDFFRSKWIDSTDLFDDDCFYRPFVQVHHLNIVVKMIYVIIFDQFHFPHWILFFVIWVNVLLMIMIDVFIRPWRSLVRMFFNRVRFVSFRFDFVSKLNFFFFFFFFFEKSRREDYGDYLTKSFHESCSPGRIALSSSIRPGSRSIEETSCCYSSNCNEKTSLSSRVSRRCFVCDSRIFGLKGCQQIDLTDSHLYQRETSNPSESCVVKSFHRIKTKYFLFHFLFFSFLSKDNCWFRRIRSRTKHDLFTICSSNISFRLFRSIHRLNIICWNSFSRIYSLLFNRLL